MLIIYIIICLLFIFLGMFITKKLLNPLTIFDAIWLFIVLLYQLHLSYLQPDISEKTIFLLICCILAFSISFILMYCVKYKNKSNKKEENQIISYTTIKKILVFWIIVELIETIYSGGIPLFWIFTNSTKTYVNYGIPTIHGFMNSIGLVIIMLCYYLYEYKKKNENIKDKSLVCIILGILLFYLLLITRQVIITAIIQLLIIKFYFIKKIPWAKLIFLSCTFIIIFGIIGNIRTGYDNFLNVAVMKNQASSILVGFDWVYMYLTMTIANVNNAVIKGITGYGLYPLANNIPSIIEKIVISNTNVVIPNYLVTKAFNVSGFFMESYLGYGVIGVIIISSIYGILGGHFLKKLEKNEISKNIIYYSIYFQIISLSFFYNHLLYLPISFQFVIIYMIYKFSNKKS